MVKRGVLGKGQPIKDVAHSPGWALESLATWFGTPNEF